jgi:hypothetical protein
MIATDPYVGAQALTMAIPLGVFVVGLLWFFFVRPRNTR